MFSVLVSNGLGLSTNAAGRLGGLHTLLMLVEQVYKLLDHDRVLVGHVILFTEIIIEVEQFRLLIVFMRMVGISASHQLPRTATDSFIFIV